MTAERTKLVEVVGLRKYFRMRGPYARAWIVRAVDGVSLYIREKETLGLVGETSCGKSTLGRTILRLHDPTGGRIFYRGEDITEAPMRPYRRKMQIVFQNPGGSLDPRMTVGGLIEEVLKANGIGRTRQQRLEIAREYLEKVGLASRVADSYPREFSGGEQQRICIARALALQPEFLVCDEPTSALDVSVQSQIVNLLEDMQSRLGLTYLFISHNLPVVRHISDRIGVMCFGKILELGDSSDVCSEPLHPYTQALMEAVPIPDPRARREHERLADILSVPAPESGCRFYPRCPRACEQCEAAEPPMKEIRPGHLCACWLY